MPNDIEGQIVAPIRFAAFDIESTGLDASYGRMLCACAKFCDEKHVRTVRAPRLRHEKAALEEIQQWFNQLDVVVTWYGKMFDIKFVNSRLLHHGMHPLPKVIHKDLCFESKSKLKFRGNRLDGVSKDLRSRVSKFDVPAFRWVEAADGNAAALDDIVKHCQLDVLLTEEMLEKMKPLILNFTR